MKRWKVVALLLVALLLATGVTLYKLPKDYDSVSEKEFTIIVKADQYENKTECRSTEATLGDYLQQVEYCEWEKTQYGTYIKAMDGIQESPEGGAYWFVYVNGEAATTGVDGIILEDAYEYTFEYTVTK